MAKCLLYRQTDINLKALREALQKLEMQGNTTELKASRGLSVAYYYYTTPHPLPTTKP